MKRYMLLLVVLSITLFFMSCSTSNPLDNGDYNGTGGSSSGGGGGGGVLTGDLLRVKLGHDNLRAVLISANSIFYSTDSGKTWKQSTYPDNSSLSDICFVPGQTDILFAVGNNTVLKSTDGGINWVSILNNLGVQGNFSSVDFKDGLIGIITASGGILRSADGGRSWTVYTNDLPKDGGGTIDISQSQLTRVSIGTNVVIVVGANGLILRSADSGANWLQIQSPGQYTFTDVYMFDNDTNGVITSAEGFVFYTVDGGLHWTQAAGIDANTPIYGVSFGASADKVWISGAAGSIYQSLDSGQTFTKQNLKEAVNSDLYGITIGPDSLHGICVGQAGIILITTAGGQNLNPWHN